MTQSERPGGWVPAFEGQRPPFQPGHTLSTRHGAYSPRVHDAVQAEVVAEVEAADPSWLQHVDTWAVEAWSYAEARCRLLRRVVSEQGTFTDKGTETTAAEQLRHWEKRAAEGRSKLGFDPTSRAKLGRDTASAAADLAQVRAAGRAAMEEQA
ncbi:MAG: hypothetical protein JWM64_241 [Frankiales bacterium]|nr:hypothetical protein [Frankiales bacterium]